MEIVWHSIQPPPGIREKMEADLRHLLDTGLSSAADLCFHTVEDDDEQPAVHVYGVKGDERFHAEYTPFDTWETG